MSREANEVLKRALELSAKDRAAVASSLIDSLDPETDDDAEQAWKQEIVRRIEDLEKGKIDAVPWEDLHRRLAAKLSNVE